MITEILVEQRHIDAGIRADCHKCPVALVLQERFPNKEIFVGAFFFCIGKNEFIIPKDLREYIIKFDKYINIKPKAFILELNGI